MGVTNKANSREPRPLFIPAGLSPTGVELNLALAADPVFRRDRSAPNKTLPKTRSGKIMRRLLKDIASGKETVGDTTTLEDYSVLAKLRSDEE